MRETIKQTRYANKVDCLLRMFEQAGIYDQVSLQNAPATLGHVCGVDIYQLVEELNLAIMLSNTMEEEE